jgi:hypothetical protein
MANVFGLPKADFTQNSNYQGLITPYVWKVLDVFFFIAGVAAVLFVVWSGIKMIQAQGDAKKFGEARSHLINAVIGIALVGAAYLILSIGMGIGKDASNLGNTPVTLPVSNNSGSSSKPPDENGGCQCPYRLVTNEDFTQTCDYDPDWICP